MANLISGSTVNGRLIEAFPVGQLLAFNQSAAPTGYTKDTSYNENCFRCVTGNVSSGGNQNFTAAFDSRGISGNISVSTGNTGISGAQIPAHNHHTYIRNSHHDDFDNGMGANSPRYTGHANFGTAGQSQGHNHTASGNFSGNNLDLRVKYVDLILASKD